MQRRQAPALCFCFQELKFDSAYCQWNILLDIIIIIIIIVMNS